MKSSVKLSDKITQLHDYLSRYSKIAVAFSGGVDSTLLLKIVFDLNPGQAIAFFADSIFQPQSERESVIALAKDIGCPLHIVEFDILANPEISENSSRRCYFCKKTIFSRFLSISKEHGCDILLDGTNLDDNLDDRPGAKACFELGVKSPLRKAGFLKKDIRILSQQMGLSNWNKPSASCLATRITTGVKISSEQLELVDKGESLLHSLGFLGCRLRVEGAKGVLELCQGDITNLFNNNLVNVIKLKLAGLGVEKIYLDLTERESDSSRHI